MGSLRKKQNILMLFLFLFYSLETEKERDKQLRPKKESGVEGSAQALEFSSHPLYQDEPQAWAAGRQPRE